MGYIIIVIIGTIAGMGLTKPRYINPVSMILNRPRKGVWEEIYGFGEYCKYVGQAIAKANPWNKQTLGQSFDTFQRYSNSASFVSEYIFLLIFFLLKFLKISREIEGVRNLKWKFIRFLTHCTIYARALYLLGAQIGHRKMGLTKLCAAPTI